MQITKLSVQARNPERVNLYLDGRFYRGLDKIVAVKLGLKPGLTLTPQLVAKVESHQTESSAWEWALRSLQRGPKSAALMRRKLLERFAPNIAQATLTHLTATGLISDNQLAEHLIAGYIASGRYSRKQIWARLKTKQLPDAIIRAALQAIPDEAETQAAMGLAARGQRKWQTLPWRERSQKIAGYLAQRGFNYAVIKRVVTRAALET